MQSGAALLPSVGKPRLWTETRGWKETGEALKSMVRWPGSALYLGLVSQFADRFPRHLCHCRLDVACVPLHTRTVKVNSLSGKTLGPSRTHRSQGPVFRSRVVSRTRSGRPFIYAPAITIDACSPSPTPAVYDALMAKTAPALPMTTKARRAQSVASFVTRYARFAYRWLHS